MPRNESHLECRQHNAQTGKDKADHGNAHFTKARHGHTGHDGDHRNLSFSTRGLAQTTSKDDRHGGDQTSHDLVEVDTDVSQTDVANGNVEAEDDTEGPRLDGAGVV